jgi:hypothetical protein
MTRTASEVIEKLDGSTIVAARLGLPATTVASWKIRGSIPPEYWLKLTRLAAEKGVAEITLASLAEMAQARTASPPTVPDHPADEPAKAS